MRKRKKLVRWLAAAPVVTVQVTAASGTMQAGSSDLTKVMIPAEAVTPGTVAMLVKPDGTTEVIKTTVPMENGIIVSVRNTATVKIVENAKSFVDVTADDWCKDAVDFVSARELFAGTTDTAFSPNAAMTRWMLMTVLARLDGVTNANRASGMEWAMANGISDGSNPNGDITREQLVVMLWRYCGSPVVSGTLSNYTDAGQIGEYAQQAMLWATQSGIIKGYDESHLVPKWKATRAQVAQILMNLLMNVDLAK